MARVRARLLIALFEGPFGLSGPFRAVGGFVRTGLLFVLPCLAAACGGGGDQVAGPPPVPAAVASVQVTLPTNEVLPGQSTQASAALRDAKGNLLSGRAIAWSSSNTAIATVSSSGTVTGVVGGGPVTIAASSEGISGSGSISVKPAAVSITAGGTYSGAWASSDPGTAAVTVLTSDPVVIENCTIRSKGTLIKATVGDAHVTVRNCRGFGIDPGVAGATRGDFFFGFKVGSLTVEHNYMESVNYGIKLYSSDGWLPSGAIIVRYNQAKNLDGVPSDGKGGRDLTHLAFGQDNGNHFFIITNSNNVPGLEVSWNEIINEPFVSSIGDAINIYSSSGSPSTPIEIHDNYIGGGYGADPFATNYVAGGITMDGRASDLMSTATAYVQIHDNQVVNHSNFGIGIAVGHDNEAYSNRVVSTGQLADGRWVMMPYGSGIYVWNCTCYNQPPTVFFNNFAHDNISGWQKPTTPSRGDYYLPDCAGGASGPSSKCTNNLSLPDPVTSEMEANETSLWRQKVIANNVTLGPSN